MSASSRASVCSYCDMEKSFGSLSSSRLPPSSYSSPPSASKFGHGNFALNFIKLANLLLALYMPTFCVARSWLATAAPRRRVMTRLRRDIFAAATLRYFDAQCL